MPWLPNTSQNDPTYDICYCLCPVQSSKPRGFPQLTGESTTPTMVNKCTAERRNDGNGGTNPPASRSLESHESLLSSESIRLADVQTSRSRTTTLQPTRRKRDFFERKAPPLQPREYIIVQKKVSYKTAQERRKSDEKGDWIHYECCRLKESIMCFSLSDNGGFFLPVGLLRTESPAPGTVAIATRQQHPSPTLLVSGVKLQGNGTETAYGRETRYSNAPSTGFHQGERL